MFCVCVIASDIGLARATISTFLVKASEIKHLWMPHKVMINLRVGGGHTSLNIQLFCWRL